MVERKALALVSLIVVGVVRVGVVGVPDGAAGVVVPGVGVVVPVVGGVVPVVGVVVPVVGVVVPVVGVVVPVVGVVVPGAGATAGGIALTILAALMNPHSFPPIPAPFSFFCLLFSTPRPQRFNFPCPLRLNFCWRTTPPMIQFPNYTKRYPFRTR